MKRILVALLASAALTLPAAAQQTGTNQGPTQLNNAPGGAHSGNMSSAGNRSARQGAQGQTDMNRGRARNNADRGRGAEVRGRTTVYRDFDRGREDRDYLRGRTTFRESDRGRTTFGGTGRTGRAASGQMGRGNRTGQSSGAGARSARNRTGSQTQGGGGQPGAAGGAGGQSGAH